MRGEQEAGCDSELGSGVVVASSRPCRVDREREDLMNLNRKAVQMQCHRPVPGSELLDLLLRFSLKFSGTDHFVQRTV